MKKILILLGALALAGSASAAEQKAEAKKDGSRPR